MSMETGSRMRVSAGAELDLPPPFHLVTLREVGDAFVHAQRVAAEEGAGTLVYVGRFDLAEFAVVLEPEEPLRSARRALYAGMNALGDALAAHAPPEKPIAFGWPDAIRVDGGLVGGARLAWPQGADEAAPPSWLVFGAMIRTVSDTEPGLRPLASALKEEGFGDVGSGALVESFSRHLMVAVDAWQENGFGVVARNYLERLDPGPPGVPATGAGWGSRVRHDIDDNGDLLVRRVGTATPERFSLLRALATPSWFDPETGGPRV